MYQNRKKAKSLSLARKVMYIPLIELLANSETKNRTYCAALLENVKLAIIAKQFYLTIP